MSLIDPVGPIRVEPAHRQVPPAPVRERYLDQPERQREERRRKRRRPDEPEESTEPGEGEHVDVKA